MEQGFNHMKRVLRATNKQILRIQFLANVTRTAITLM